MFSKKSGGFRRGKLSWNKIELQRKNKKTITIVTQVFFIIVIHISKIFVN